MSVQDSLSYDSGTYDEVSLLTSPKKDMVLHIRHTLARRNDARLSV